MCVHLPPRAARQGWGALPLLPLPAPAALPSFTARGLLRQGKPALIARRGCPTSAGRGGGGATSKALLWPILLGLVLGQGRELLPLKLLLRVVLGCGGICPSPIWDSLGQRFLGRLLPHLLVLLNLLELQHLPLRLLL
jgi:hypothetical protein